MAKTMTINDILTPAEIKRAEEIFATDQNNFHKRCQKELIEPNMARINRKLGQENDPSFLAYAVEAVLRFSAPAGTPPRGIQP